MVRIRQLTVSGLRNLNDMTLSFAPEQEVYAFVGKNGQGKTNLLEAIYLCALSKSFRCQSNEDLIQFHQDYCRVELKTQDDELTFFVSRKPLQKTLKVNQVKRPAAEFIGHLKAVFFSPDDLSDMAFAPKLRRRYLDVLLTQLKKGYLQNLSQYESARKQRNALLKSIREGVSQKNELSFWNTQLTKFGLKLLDARRTLVKEINPHVHRHYQSIAESKDEVNIIYTSKMEDVLTEEEYLEVIESHQEKDILIGKTQWGPHVDDLIFRLSEKDMQRFASRGEWRSLVLAMKFAEIDLIRNLTSDEPVLLLDDVFSELDEWRQKYLFKAIQGFQTFITTTHDAFLDESKAVVYRVSQGSAKKSEK